MTSRERIAVTLEHGEPDRVPMDLGGTAVTGMHVSSVYRLRQALGLDPPGTPVKVVEPYQMLGEIQTDLMDSLGVDVVGLTPETTFFGFPARGWKPWTLFDGTPVRVPEGFNTVPDKNGDILLYPEGDRTAAASGRMPNGGFYFDAVVRQPPIQEILDVRDNLEEFRLLSEEELDRFEEKARSLYETSERALIASFGGTSFGDIALVPAPWLKNPKGIRDVEEWYISTVSRRDYVWKIFEEQCETGLENLERLARRLAPYVSVLFVSGTDFGMQTGSFISPESYRELYKPFHEQVNRWVHENTPWKTFMHSCGSVIALLDDIIDAGFDIINPVQCSAVGMEPEGLKRRFGERIVFWGGGADTQHTLPFGEPGTVRREVMRRIGTFAPGGGFVFAAIHNVQAKIPEANLLALYEGYRECREYAAAERRNP